MLSVSEALQHIQQHVIPSSTRTLSLSEAVGMALAQEVFSPMNFPNVPQAAVDGYGFRLPEKNQDETHFTFPIQTIIQAGDTSDVVLLPHHGVRIFTGAKVPAAVNCIVMQEFVRVEANGEITISMDNAIPLAHIRPTASQCTAGDLLMKKQDVLTPGAIAFLASVGILSVEVFQQPKVGILPTGKELVKVGQPLLPGQVYESNSLSLSAVLKQLRIPFQVFDTAEDDLESLTHQVQQALSQCDVLLITGGVSVGDYDFVLEACARNEVTSIFHKVKQRPGKPLYFGMKKHQVIFGLPGNPASVLSCFYLFVYPALRLFGGFAQAALPSLEAPLQEDYIKKSGLTFFLRARWEEGRVHIPKAQESYKMNAFASANAIIELEETKENYAAGEMVKVYLLPF